MAIIIPIAHDFICPWCWVGLLQAKKLEHEFDVTIEWVGYELFPIDLEWPDYPAATPPPANKPVTPTRFEFLLAADGYEMPTAERPKKMRTYNAHQALEYAKAIGRGNAFNEVLYRALWERGENINEVDVLLKLSEGLIENKDELHSAIVNKQFHDKVVGFDDPAYASGVYNVPTFFIAGERYAEQPYSVLKKAVAKALEAQAT